MNNAPALLRTLITFAVIVPVAVFVGYLLSNPIDASTFTYVGALTAILLFPILLRWHHPLLILSWNSGMFVIFLPGQPRMWMAMTAVSLGITLLQRALGGVKRLISVPQVTWSLICLIGVMVLTAKLTGMGVHALGSDISGGRRYIDLLGAILAYFAISSRRIPPERAHLYVGMFFLPGLLSFISDFWQMVPGAFRFIYWFFPAREISLGSSPFEKSSRLAGGILMTVAVFSFMQARYGIRGSFLSGKHWRWIFLALAFGYGLLAGYRGYTMLIILVFFIQFFIEGLHRTKLMMIFAFAGVLGAVALIPLSPHLPRTAQRALSFLPLEIDTVVRQDAENTSKWRLEMWKSILPQVPQHLLLGKGYAVSRRDMDLITGTDAAVHVGTFSENQYFALAGAFHNGPLSVVMIFGLWGVVAVIWFWVAGIWVLYNNYHYGNPALRTVNTFLLAAFVARVIFFLVIFGDLCTDMLFFSGWLGLSVALNGGVCHPAPAPAMASSKLPVLGGVRPHLQPTFRRPDVQV